MSTTTIQLKEDTKETLDTHKQDGESYDDVVRRLAGTDGELWTEQEIEEIAERVVEQYARR